MTKGPILQEIWDNLPADRKARIEARTHALEVERIQAAMITENKSSPVRLVPPNRDPQAIEQAYALAKKVESELAAANSTANSTKTFDEYLASRRV